MMSNMVLNHFSHEHPLVFADEAGKEVECYGCKKSISGSVYSCGECDYFLHKKCAELPLEIQDPMHTEHPLTLYKTPPNFLMSCICNVCANQAGWEGFTYTCKICQFDVDILCFLNEPTIDHQGHHHPLTLLLNEATFACHACGTESEKEQSYLCTKCQFWIHKSCALSPTTITHTDHPDHPLALGFSLPYENRSFTYFCEICKGKMHPSDWLYYCDKCRYFLHIKCANTTREKGHWASECRFAHVPCIRGCPFEMKLRQSIQPHSYGCRFLNCKGQVEGCNAFLWIDNPTSTVKDDGEASTSKSNTKSSNQGNKASTKNVKVIVEENGKKTTYEGELDAVMMLMNKNLRMN